jgi:hypothetical protein
MKHNERNFQDVFGIEFLSRKICTGSQLMSIWTFNHVTLTRDFGKLPRGSVFHTALYDTATRELSFSQNSAVAHFCLVVEDEKYDQNFRDISLCKDDTSDLDMDIHTFKLKHVPLTSCESRTLVPKSTDKRTKKKTKTVN